MREAVEFLSGYAYAEKPVALTWEAERLEITDVLAEWRTPLAKHFRVRTSDGRYFELSCAEPSGEWQIQEL